MLFLAPPDGTNFNYSYIKSTDAGLLIDVGSGGGTRALTIEASGVVNAPQGLQSGGNNVITAANIGSYASGSAPLLSALNNYVWSASTLPTGYSQGIQCSFVYSGWQSYGSVMTMNTYSGGGGALQLYVPYSPTYGGTGLQARFGNYDVSSGNSWTSWKTLLASDNYGSYSTFGGKVTSGGNNGFANDVYYGGVRNPIWSFGNAPSYGISYYQGAAGVGGGDTIGFSVNGTTSATSNNFAIANGASYVNNNVILHAGNYTSYAPSLGGSGASGTWGINITGSAGSATSAIRLVYNDGPRDLSDRFPNSFTRTVNFDFVGAGTANGTGNYGGVMTYSPWTGTTASTGDSSYQLAFANNSGLNASGQPKLSIRNGIDTTWNAWYTLLHSGNYTSYSPSLTGSGASGTWGINITGNAATVGGLDVHPGRNDNANRIVRTDGNGYIQAGWINTTSGNSGVENRLTRIYSSYDDYLRYSTLTDFKVHIGESAKNNYSRRIDYTSDSNYWVGSFGHGGYGANETFHGGSGFFDIWSGSNYPSGTSHIHGFNALHYTTNSLGSTGGNAYGIQVAGQYNQGGLLFSRGCSAGGFSGWRRQIDDNNYTDYAVSLTYNSSLNSDSRNSRGVTRLYRRDDNSDYSVQTYWTGSHWYLAGYSGDGFHADCRVAYSDTTGTAARATRANGNFYIDDNYGNGIVGVYASTRYQGVFAMGDSYKLAADGTSTGSLYGMAWSHPNAGGVAGNLDSHGMLVLINGGFGSCMSYSIKASGNVTAYSDERLKTNWRPMPESFVERLAAVKVGIYDRTDGERITQVGVSAQSLQRLLPEAITKAGDEMGTLSVSYGNAAMASAVELAKELVQLKRELAELKSKLH
jgi:hypothetical protein